MYVEYDCYGEESQDDEARKILAKANGFSARDLAKNAQGRITFKQSLLLLVRGVMPLLELVVPLAGLLALAAALYFGVPFIGMRARAVLLVAKYGVMLSGVIGLGLLAIVLKSMIASGRLTGLVADVLLGRAVCLVGRVSLSRSEEIEDGIDQLFRKRTHVFHYVIRGEYFEVDESAYEEMRDLDGTGWYTVYYTPRSKFLLSIEPATGTPLAEAA